MNTEGSETPQEIEQSIFGENPTLTFKAGGWVLLVAALISFALLAWALSGVFFSERPVGDGTDVASYQFSMDGLNVSPKVLSGSGNPRDFLSTYENPAKILGRDILAYNEQSRRPWLVTDDRVVGVVIGISPRHRWF